MKYLVNQNGTNTVTLYDSLSDDNLECRKDYNIKYGFNQKKYIFLGKHSHVSLKDYSDTYKLDQYKFPAYLLKTPYGMVVNEHVKLKAINHNKYNAINFNLHIICFSENSGTMENLAKKTFNTLKLNQDEGAIPRIYQYSDLKSNKIKSEVVCNVTTSLKSSPSFKNECKIVKSYKQRLNPGDIFEFNYKYRCGSGVRLDLLKDRINPISSGDQPSSYGFIIEALGYDCEAINIEDQSLRYIGKSPGFFNLEMKKQLELCLQSTDVSSFMDLKDDSKNYAIRVYSKNLKTQRDFNFNYTDLDKKYRVVTYGVEKVRLSGNSNFNKKDLDSLDNKDITNFEEIENDE